MVLFVADCRAGDFIVRSMMGLILLTSLMAMMSCDEFRVRVTETVTDRLLLGKKRVKSEQIMSASINAFSI
jgi:hypothetical protein